MAQTGTRNVQVVKVDDVAAVVVVVQGKIVPGKWLNWAWTKQRMSVMAEDVAVDDDEGIEDSDFVLILVLCVQRRTWHQQLAV